MFNQVPSVRVGSHRPNVTHLRRITACHWYPKFSDRLSRYLLVGFVHCEDVNVPHFQAGGYKTLYRNGCLEVHEVKALRSDRGKSKVHGKRLDAAQLLEIFGEYEVKEIFRPTRSRKKIPHRGELDAYPSAIDNYLPAGIKSSARQCNACTITCFQKHITLKRDAVSLHGINIANFEPKPEQGIRHFVGPMITVLLAAPICSYRIMKSWAIRSTNRTNPNPEIKKEVVVAVQVFDINIFVVGEKNSVWTLSLS
ncbi:hypothetical protein EDB85DRAFT_1888309 [Lactarius pseudohatsudake]|nr:hypothetical protein EDB85DRAFT_1888309 [Lactarius pseudohatsudake]